MKIQQNIALVKTESCACAYGSWTVVIPKYKSLLLLMDFLYVDSYSTFYSRYVSMKLCSAGERCILQHQSKQGRDQRLKG